MNNIKKPAAPPKREKAITCFVCQKQVVVKVGLTSPAGWRRLNLYFNKSAINGRYSCGDCVSVTTPEDFLELICKAMNEYKLRHSTGTQVTSGVANN